MPRGDRTGPLGAGPMTGRAAGYCAGYQVPGFMNSYGGGGRGLARGFGGGRGGRGAGRGFAAPMQAVPMGYPVGSGFVPAQAPTAQFPQNAPIDAGMELNALKNQAGMLEASLEQISARIADLEANHAGPGEPEDS